MTGNADQIDYWNQEAGLKWAAQQARLDALLAPFAEAVVEALAVQPGEKIIDVGCGCGATTLELARAAAPGGSALGVDVSAPMLEVARTRAAAEGVPAEFLLADATTADLPAASFDALASRFGVMFFEDPTVSFTHLRSRMKPGARLAFMCWRKLNENPWVTTALMPALAHVEAPPRPGPEDPGPFSFGEPERVHRILGKAGFVDVLLTPFDAEIDIASGEGVDGAFAFMRQIGPCSAILREAPPEAAAKAEAAMREALAPHAGANGTVPLRGGTWLVSARVP